MQALQKLPVQVAYDIKPSKAAQPGLPFFSKSATMSIPMRAPMSAALNALVPPVPRQDAPSFRPHECTDSKLFDRIGSAPSSKGVAALLSAFHATGGVVRGDELASMLEHLKIGDLASLGKAMASGEICSFQWRSAFWIPMFQFDLDKLTLQRGPRSVVQELTGVFDGWMLSAWFAQPNSWLGSRKPVDCLASNLPSVLEAARADRYVAVG